MEKNIAVLLWEPLAWRASELSTDGVWRRDGPELPVEYAALGSQNAGGRRSMLSLALRPGWRRNPVLWSRMVNGDIEGAIRELGALLGEDGISFIDMVDGDNRTAHPDVIGTIEQWAEDISRRSRRVDAVIWMEGRTGLQDNMMLAPRPLIDMLRTSTERERRNTELYVRCTPAQLRTPLRDVMEREMGWTPFTMVERLNQLQVRT